MPYGHGTLGAWPHPRNPRNLATAASASQTTTIQYSPFPDRPCTYLCVILYETSFQSQQQYSELQ